MSRSERGLVSRSVGVDGWDPVDPRWAGVVLLRALPTDAGASGVDDGCGEWARGRLVRVSTK